MSEQKQVQITPLQKDINAAVSNANALVIKDADGLQTASEYLRQCGLRIKAIGMEFDDIVSKANATHKAATSQRKRHLDPVNKAKVIINLKVVQYKQELDRIAAEKRAEETRKAKEAQDAQKLEEAAALQNEGETELAEAVLVEERPLEIISEPEPVAQPEGMSFRDNWQFEVYDIKSIPAEYLTVDDKAVRGVVKAMKQKTNIPGIRVFNNKTVIQKT